MSKGVRVDVTALEAAFGEGAARRLSPEMAGVAVDVLSEAIRCAGRGDLQRQSIGAPVGWQGVMRELAQSLESEVESRRVSELDRRIERDLEPVHQAYALLGARDPETDPRQDRNAFGLDVRYAHEKLELVLRDLDRYTPTELARTLARLSVAVDPRVLGKELEFTSIRVGEL